MKHRIKYSSWFHFRRLAFTICTSYVCISSLSLAQNKVIDSLRHVLKTDKEDTNKVNHLNTLAYYFRNINPDTTIILGEQAGDLAKKIGWLKGEGMAFRNTGLGYYVKCDYPKALDNYYKALTISEESNYTQLKATTLSYIGLVCTSQGDYPKALEYDLKALKMAEEFKYKQLQANTLSNIGMVYFDQADYPKSIEYQLKSLKMNGYIKLKGFNFHSVTD
ncbi:MAG: tetratricopeptide repeat protein [Bacteroidia bacterium]